MASGKYRHLSRRYTNPYFSRPEPRRRWPKLLGWGIGLALPAAIVAVWFSPWLQIRGIIIEGADPRTTRALYDTVLHYGDEKVVGQRRFAHRVLIRADTLIQRLHESAFVGTIAVAYRFPSTLEISVSERQPRVAIAAGDSAWFVADDEGFVLQDDMATSTPALPQLIVAGAATPTPRASVLPEHLRLFVAQLVTASPGSMGSIRSITVPQPTDPFVEVSAEQGWKVKFNAQRDLDDQLMALERVITELKIDRQRLDYIDVRYADRVFFKEK